MGDCPNKECRDRLDEVHNTVFKDKEGGCRFDIRKLRESILTRTTAWIFLGVILIPLVSYGFKLYVDHEKRLTRQEDSIEFIKIQFRKMEVSQEKIIEKVDRVIAEVRKMNGHTSHEERVKIEMD